MAVVLSPKPPPSFRARFPHYAELIAAWGAHFGETITEPVPGVHAIVAALAARGVPLFAITNFSADFWPPFRAREAAFFDQFRDIVVSGEEKLLKPERAIYDRALDRFGLAAGRGFVRRRPPGQCRRRAAAGMHAHLFTDAADLAARLEDEGLL